MFLPRPLKSGDTIAICSPAGPANIENVEAAVPVLEQQGWAVKGDAACLGACRIVQW